METPPPMLHWRSIGLLQSETVETHAATWTRTYTGKPPNGVAWQAK